MKLQPSDQGELLEVFKEGAVRSAETLGALFGSPWSIRILSLDIGSGEQFRSLLARDEREYLCVQFSSPGERYVVMFSEESGRAMLNACAPPPGGGRPPLPRMGESTLAEIANILVNGLAGELADRQGMMRIISAPHTARSRKADVYGQALEGLHLIDKTLVNVMIHIASSALTAECTVILCLDALSATLLLNTVPETFHFPY
jgi:chemotaxis protein CheY-P-specific phosphatase CheC